MNRKRAQASLEQATLHLERGEAERALSAALEVVEAKAWPDEAPYALAGEALRQLGRIAEAKTLLQEGVARHVGASQLLARLATLELHDGHVDKALKRFEQAKPGLKREPTFLVHYAAALLEADQPAKAEAELGAALVLGGGADARLVMALVKRRQGLYVEAESFAKQAEQSRSPDVQAQATSLRASLRLLQGDAADALALWERLEGLGRLDEESMAPMAYAAQQVGETELANAMMARRVRDGATADDRLIFAHLANLRLDAPGALEQLALAESVGGPRSVGWAFEAASARGRALRLLGRREEAEEVLAQAAAMPEAAMGAAAARVLVDQGQLAADAGRFELAEGFFQRALVCVPGEPEAANGLTLVKQRLAWRATVTADAEARVEAARAEALAEARRLQARERELEQLRHELERLKAHAASSEARASQLAQEATSQAARNKAEEERRLQAELDRRETHADETSEVLLTQWLGSAKARCPPALWQVLLVAERTYQRAVFTELPAAAVAVLYSGALERALVTCLVADFTVWLEGAGVRQPFLQAATRERRAGRTEYFDHFVEAFDPDFRGRPPSLGEFARALAKRDEPYLSLFGGFLKGRGFSKAVLTAAAEFIAWSKERIRDPAAHGHADAVDWGALKRFREQLLVRFEGGPGLVPTLLAAREP